MLHGSTSCCVYLFFEIFRLFPIVNLTKIRKVKNLSLSRYNHIKYQIETLSSKTIHQIQNTQEKKKNKMEETQNQVLEEEAKGSTTVEKVYIAVGNDLQEGFKTIDWALKKWDNISISIVLLHLCSISQDFVYTPCTISSFSIRTSSFSFQSYKPQFTSLS